MKPKVTVLTLGVRSLAISRRFYVEGLGWKPLVAFDEGIEETVKWYVDHRAWWEAILARTGNLAFDWAAGATSPSPTPSR